MRFILTAMLMTMEAAGGVQAEDLVVQVALRGGVETSSTLAFQAKVLAGKMFAEIGIRIEWLRWSGKNRPGVIVMALTPEATPSSSDGALAQAQPFDGMNIAIFMGRVRERVGMSGAPNLLAYVMVHEITHVLQGTDSHSIGGGVMNAKWDRADFNAMANGALTFRPVDIELIKAGIAKRMPSKNLVLTVKK